MGPVTGHRVVGALLCAFILNALVVADHVTPGDKDDKHLLGRPHLLKKGWGFGWWWWWWWWWRWVWSRW
ncbi:hypothetical protein OIU78_009418 [Salix suchowensis]|nr:hypothetical protein OIU78_009418 [Salix suchowensis]